MLITIKKIFHRTSSICAKLKNSFISESFGICRNLNTMHFEFAFETCIWIFRLLGTEVEYLETWEYEELL